MDMDVPSEEEIRALDMGALIALRARLLAASGTVDRSQPNHYDAILASTIGLAIMLAGRVEQPPAPDWVRAIDAATGAPPEIVLPEPEPLPETHETHETHETVDWEALMAEDAKAASVPPAPPPRPTPPIVYDSFDDPNVETRIAELIDRRYSDTQIWNIISKEFRFNVLPNQG